MKRMAVTVLAALVMFLGGCGYFTEYVDIAKNERLSKAYITSLKKWTREKTAYSEFETRVRIAATYRSGEFRKAYKEEYDRVYLSNGVSYAGPVDVSPGMAEFLFYAYTPDKKANDFSKAGSVWRVFLITPDGRRMTPVDLREIEDVTPAVKEFFPYVQPSYGRFYSVKFETPKGAETPSDAVTLVFTGVLGKVELSWN